jgi:hypothetical protein
MGLFISKAWIPPDDILGCVASTVGLVEGEEPVVECLPPFSEPDWYWGLAQVLTLMTLYGYILFYASNLLSSGSELLLLVPSLAGIVGSVVLPCASAAPDRAVGSHGGAREPTARARGDALTSPPLARPSQDSRRRP